VVVVVVVVVVAFRLMTWNVQNLLPVGSKGGPPTQAALDAKLASLAQVIDAQQPDVLALQEVGPPQMLEPLQERLTHKLPHREVSAHPDGRGIRVAVLSRLPLQDPVQAHQFPAGLAPVQVGDPPTGSTGPPPTLDHMGRGALQVTVTADGQDLTIITAHLKSKLLTFPQERFQPHDENERARFGAYALDLRAAEAVTLRAHLTGVLHGAGTSLAVLLAGDLNDGVEAATTQLLQGPPGSELETAGFAHPDQGDGQRMWNLAVRIPQAQRFTRVFRGHLVHVLDVHPAGHIGHRSAGAGGREQQDRQQLGPQELPVVGVVSLVALDVGGLGQHAADASGVGVAGAVGQRRPPRPRDTRQAEGVVDPDGAQVRPVGAGGPEDVGFDGGGDQVALPFQDGRDDQPVGLEGAWWAEGEDRVALFDG